MRQAKISSEIATVFALLASTACVQAVSAQTAPDQSVPTTPATATAATAAAATAGAATAPGSSILSVSLPPYARLRFDMDVRDEDVLGVVKSFFRGFNGQSLKELLDWLRASRMATAPASGAPASGTDGSSVPGTSRDLDKMAAVQMLSDADLGTMLRDINHMRVVVFDMPRTAPRRSSTNQATPAGGAAAGAANRPVPQSVVAYYEQRYLAGEGGRRIMRGDFDDVQMLTVGFPGRGFASVFQAPGIGVVIRSDGYPNFEGIGPFVMATLLRFNPPQSPNRRSVDDDD